MNEREYDSRLSELRLNLIMARREHYSLIATAVFTSSLAISTLPTALYSDAPTWLIATLATVGVLGSKFAINETEKTKADLEEAKERLENFQDKHFIERINPPR